MKAFSFNIIILSHYFFSTLNEVLQEKFLKSNTFIDSGNHSDQKNILNKLISKETYYDTEDSSL